MSNITVSNYPSEQQLERIFQILGEVFSVGRAYFEDRLVLDQSYDPATTWYAAVDETVASTTQIFPLHLRVGKAIIKVGGIGSVGTDPQYRGMGLAPKVLQAQSKWMQENHYDLSVLLASKHAFYEKAGWHLVVEPIYTMPAPAVEIAHGSYEIIPFQARYLPDMQRIYEKFNENRTYTLVRNTTYWNDLMKWPAWYQSDCLLLRSNGSIVGYGIIDQASGDQVILNELMYVREYEDGVAALFSELCKLRPGAKHIVARLTQDHILHNYCMDNNGTKNEQRMAMWKMINSTSLFNKLRPELEERLIQSQYASQTLSFAIAINNETIYMYFDQGKLSLQEQVLEQNQYIHIKLDATKLIESIMFGYRKGPSLENANLGQPAEAEPKVIQEPTAEELSLLAALFPEQDSVYYWTDRY